MSLSDLFIDMAATCPATGSHFIPEDGFGLFQLIFLTLVYGYILASSSKMIADGSELLLLVLNPGIVGEAGCGQLVPCLLRDSAPSQVCLW